MAHLFWSVTLAFLAGFYNLHISGGRESYFAAE